MEGIESHLEVTKRKIEEAQLVLPILLKDIAILEKGTQTADVIQQLQEKRKHLASARNEIAFQKANLLKEDDFQSYINATKKDHVYCGIAQLFDLSKEYQIPIRVIYNYGKTDQYEQIFNTESNLGKNPPLPTLTVAHVNGNHFQYVNS